MARERLSAQLQGIDAVDNKIGLLVSLASALMGILAAVVALRGHSMDAPAIALTVLSALTYLFVAFKSLEAYSPKKWKEGPNLLQVWETLKDDTEDDRLIKWQVANALWRAHEINAAGYSAKAKVLPLLLVGVVIQTLLLSLLALALVLGEVLGAVCVLLAVAVLLRGAAVLRSDREPA
jgi:hypothetical protein